MKRLIWLAVMVGLGTGAWWWLRAPVTIRNMPPREGPVVAFGDSLTAGVGAGANEAYPARLASLIGRPVVNKGVPGNTVADATARLERDVLALKPGVVIVLLGGNDYLRQLDRAASFAGLREMIRRIQAEGAVVVLVGLEGLLPGSGIGGQYKRLAAETGCVYVPNVLGGVIGNRDLMSDQIHPNAQGYRIMADRIAAAAGNILNK